MRTTRAQQVVTLRERYEEMAQANEQEAYRAIGQAQALTWVVGQLSLLTAEAKPARVQALVEDLLASLSEQKASRLIVCIREKRRHSVTVAGEWMAQGAIGQIDEIAQELCARLTPQWNATSPKRHGLSFQVYHRGGYRQSQKRRVGSGRGLAPYLRQSVAGLSWGRVVPATTTAPAPDGSGRYHRLAVVRCRLDGRANWLSGHRCHSTGRRRGRATSLIEK